MRSCVCVCVNVCVSARRRGHSPVTRSGCVMNDEERCLQSRRDLGETLFHRVKNGLVLCQRLRECYKTNVRLQLKRMFIIFRVENPPRQSNKLIKY